MISIQTLRAAGMLVALGSWAGIAQAASISFYLDQSSAEGTWPDGVDYVQVTISDSAIYTGDIEFVVTPLAALTGLAGPNFGIQAFGFNTTGTAGAVTAANIIDPAGWSASEGDRLDGFGTFEIRTDTTGSYRQNPLQFRITGIAGDSPADYAVAASGGEQGSYFFAAHVAGMTSGPGSAYFGGGTSVTALVPIPASLWLLGSAVGLLGMMRRRT